MTRRYIPAPRARRVRAWWEHEDPNSEDRPLTPSLSVHEPADTDPQPTGLYDANGVELYRVDEREPVGFLAGRVR